MFSHPMHVWKSVSLLAVWLLAGLAPFSSAVGQHAHSHQHGSSSTHRPVELGTSVAIDRQGRLWAATKEIAEGGDPYVSLRSSLDMGESWSAPQQLVQEPVTARGEERPKVAFGPKGELYLLYTKPATHSKNPHIGDIRFVRSTDGGKSFSKPVTVHANRDIIAHAFGSMIVDKAGHIYVAWIDSRDREAARERKEAYAGNALYYAVSTDGGKTFKGDYKIADHACECCRISLSLNGQGRPVAMWRHIFAPNIRDHALAELTADARPQKIARASFDDWRVDACPHHGPSLAYAADGTRHQVWFNGKEGNGGGVQYAAAGVNGDLGMPVSLGSAQASHADVSVWRKQIAIAWKEFDGQSTVIRGKLSSDGGVSWQEKEFAKTAGDSDKPYLINTPAGTYLIWHTRDEGLRVIQAAKGT